MENKTTDMMSMTLTQLLQEKQKTKVCIQQTEKNIKTLRDRLDGLKKEVGDNYRQVIEDCKEKMKHAGKHTLASFALLTLFIAGGFCFLSLYNVFSYILFACGIGPLVAALVFTEQGAHAQQIIKSIMDNLECIRITTEAIQSHEEELIKHTNYLAQIDARLGSEDTELQKVNRVQSILSPSQKDENMTTKEDTVNNETTVTDEIEDNNQLETK